MPRAAPSPSPVRDTPQTSARVPQFFGRDGMGLEKAGMSAINPRASQCPLPLTPLKSQPRASSFLQHFLGEMGHFCPALGEILKSTRPRKSFSGGQTGLMSSQGPAQCVGTPCLTRPKNFSHRTGTGLSVLRVHVAPSSSVSACPLLTAGTPCAGVSQT